MIYKNWVHKFGDSFFFLLDDSLSLDETACKIIEIDLSTENTFSVLNFSFPQVPSYSGPLFRSSRTLNFSIDFLESKNFATETQNSENFANFANNIKLSKTNLLVHGKLQVDVFKALFARLFSGSSEFKFLTSISFIGFHLEYLHLSILSEYLSYKSCCLERLILVRNKLGSSGLSELAQGISNSHKLIGLVIDDNQLSNYDIYELRRALRKKCLFNPFMDLLSLSNNLIDDAGSEALSHLLKEMQLQRLDLSGNNLTYYSIYYLKDFIPSLKYFDIGFNPKITFKGFTELLDLSAMKTSYLTCISFSGLGLGNEMIDEVIEVIKTPFCRIRRLGLADNELDDDIGEEIAVALAINNSLLELDLSYNQFSNQWIRHLALGIQFNRHLSILHLLGMPEELDSSTTMALERSIKMSGYLTILFIHTNNKLLEERLKESLMVNINRYATVKHQALSLLRTSRVILHAQPASGSEQVTFSILPLELLSRVLFYSCETPRYLHINQIRSIINYAAQRPDRYYRDYYLSSSPKVDVYQEEESFLSQVACLRPLVSPSLSSNSKN